MIVIDPSVRACGWAIFYGRDLESAGVVQATDPVDLADRLAMVMHTPNHSVCLIERPRIYPHSPVPPNDIVTLGIAVGVATALARVRGIRVEYTYPTQLNKTVTEHRVRKVLNPDKMLKTVPKSLQHNAIDAIHLGMIHVS